MVAVVVEAAQQPAVERVVGGEPVTEGILRSGAAITVHIAHPTRRDAYLVEGKDVVLGKVAYRCWVQDDTSSSAFQQDIGAFVHLYVASGVAEDQRGGESAQRSPHYHDTWSRRSCIHLVIPHPQRLWIHIHDTPPTSRTTRPTTSPASRASNALLTASSGLTLSTIVFTRPSATRAIARSSSSSLT